MSVTSLCLGCPFVLYKVNNNIIHLRGSVWGLNEFAHVACLENMLCSRHYLFTIFVIIVMLNFMSERLHVAKKMECKSLMVGFKSNNFIILFKKSFRLETSWFLLGLFDIIFHFITVCFQNTFLRCFHSDNTEVYLSKDFLIWESLFQNITPVTGPKILSSQDLAILLCNSADCIWIQGRGILKFDRLCRIPLWVFFGFGPSEFTKVLLKVWEDKWLKERQEERVGKREL